MGIVPISARVAIQLVAVELRKRPNNTRPITHIALFALAQLPPDYPGMVRFALHSLSVYLDLGLSSAQWLKGVLEASHFGHSFRRCFFFDYKGNRGPYPRVTNRGVQTSKSGRKSRMRRDSPND